MRTAVSPMPGAVPLAWAFEPGDAVLRWPGEARLVALLSGGGGAWSRWSILAPPAGVVTIETGEADVKGALRRALPEATTAQLKGFPVACPLAVVRLGYELGAAFEPAAPMRATAAPLAEIHTCLAAAVYDHLEGVWWGVGDSALLPALDEREPDAPGAEVGAFTSASGRRAYTDAVRAALAYIGAGDVYQVNLAHRLRAPLRGSTRGLFVRAAGAMSPWFGAYIESPRSDATLSLSPELFLSYDAATRRVVTRPIKGTRAAAVPPDELLASEKDAAELAMIVDLMRNDLGRVCAYGSVRVAEARALEVHGGAGDAGVRHSVATVEGALRHSMDLADLLAASFPPGSITGAPKVRAMQIIGELERVSRGAYCGCVGFVSATGDARLNVAIRTAQAHGRAPDASRVDVLDGVVDYHIGAGIVADSDPDSEWRETLDKAAGFLRAVGSELEASP